MQQVEGHVLAPVVLGRATALHPLAVIVCLTAGGLLLGVLGAFLAVPVAASVARSIAYLRSDDRPVTSQPASHPVPLMFAATGPVQEGVTQRRSTEVHALNVNASGPSTVTITGI